MLDELSKRLMHCGNCEQKVNTVPACGWPNQRLRCCTNCHAHTYYTGALPKPPDEPLRLETLNIATQPIIIIPKGDTII